MKVFRASPPNINQPIFSFGQWSRKPIKLMDNVSRYRAMAADLNLSTQAQLRLEWMIFYETVGDKDAYKTAKHFAITPKTFYKRHKRFDNGLVHQLEDESRAPINKRKWTVTIEEQSRIKKLRLKYIHYGKKSSKGSTKMSTGKLSQLGK